MRNARRARRGFVVVPLLAVLAMGCEKLPAVPNIPPVASFVYSPVSPIVAGETPVGFNASASSDSDGTISSYIWNFGDGTPEQAGGASAVTHVFPVVGRCVEVTYTVLLTVVDQDGGRSSANQTVRVVNLPTPGSDECR